MPWSKTLTYYCHNAFQLKGRGDCTCVGYSILVLSPSNLPVQKYIIVKVLSHTDLPEVCTPPAPLSLLLLTVSVLEEGEREEGVEEREEE